MEELDASIPAYEYYYELMGLRKQNDALREQLSVLRNDRDRTGRELSEALQQIKKLEEERAGIKRAAHYLRRKSGTSTTAVSGYHRTVNGTHPICQARIDVNNYELVELTEPPDGLCARCGGSTSAHHSLGRNNKQWFSQVKPDPNPLFTTVVYIFHAQADGRCKVGISTDVQGRYRTLRHASGAELKVYFISAPCTSQGAREAEYDVRSVFDRNRVAQEWYKLNQYEMRRVRQIIEERVLKDRSQKAKKSV